ncbi:ABC transporter substrate-binding protein [Corynebacterium sp.]|uniref:heme/hemin ABC transporter substrate-binding protein n=1 Tax=Corynebacterium sp. TaxID=1720 RepID=UPI0028B02B51|nr:ABC transporter substrate-binding protein [Corynebacterium sp.]
MLKKARITAIALGTAAMLTLTGCASWDDTSATNAALQQELQDGETVDQATATGVAKIDNLAEVEPITDSASPSLPVELTDADGHDVVVEDVSRIVALDLYGTYTKTLRGLGLGENIIGRTVSSSEESLKDVPSVTAGGHDINVEAVLNLDPSLVIVDHSIGPASAIDQIRAAGVPTVVMSPERSITTIGQDIMNVAGVVGLPEEGEKLAERSEKELSEAQEAIAAIIPEEPLRMAFLYARGTGGVFYILGSEDGTSDLIESLGGVDVATKSGVGAASPASAEALVELNPQVFVMMNAGLESTGDIAGLLDRPGFAQTDAGKNQRVISLPDGDSLAFGPQTGEMLLRAAKALYLGEDEGNN